MKYTIVKYIIARYAIAIDNFQFLVEFPKLLSKSPRFLIQFQYNYNELYNISTI